MANPSINIVINAVNNAKKALGDATKDLDAFKASVNSAKNSLLGLVGISLSGAFIKGLIETADKWLSLNAQIRNSTSTSEEFVVAQQAVIDISRKTYTSLEANAGLFSKINLAIKAMGGDTKQSIGAVDQIAKLVALSGTSAEAAAAGIFQFTQSLAANRFSGQEYNSVAEQTPALLKAIYEGLGVNIGTLRKMAEEGALDTATVLAAIEKSTARTNAAFAKLPVTFSKASQNMANAWLEFIGKLNESESVTSTLGAGINLLADNMSTLGDYTLKFLAIGFVAGIGKMIASLATTVRAMQLARLEAQANVVANAQLEASERARIATLYAEVAAQEADIRAKIAETEATIAVTQADIRSTQAMIANAATMQARAALVARIAVLNGELAASQAVLTEQQLALNAVQTQGALTMKSLASATALFSVGAAGLIGWEIGTWARESFVWVEKLGVAIAGVTHLLIKGFDTSRQKGEFSQLAKDYIDQFHAVGKESIKDTKEKQEAEKQAAEQAKVNEEVKVKAIADGIKKSQAKLEALNAARKASYEQDLRNLDQAEQAKLTALNNALPERLGVEETYQSTKQIIVQKGALTEQQRLEQQTALEIQTNNQRLNLTRTYNEQKLADVTRIYDAEIATMKSRNLATDQLEKESNDAKKAILLDLEKGYETSINKLTAIDQQHRNKAIGYLNEINGQEQNRLNQLRALDAVGLTDAQATEQRKRQILEDTAQVKKLIAAGEYAKAVELSKKLQDLTFQQAQATKQAAAEQNKKSAGTGNDFAAKQARDQYNESVNLSTQALQGAANAEIQQADIAKKSADKQRLSLEQVRNTIKEIDAAITKTNTLKVNVDDSEVNAAIKKINDIPTDKTVTIHTVEGHQTGGVVGGVLRRATGGAINFVKRAGGKIAGFGGGDTIPLLAERGEYVLNKSVTRTVGVGALNALNRGNADIIRRETGGIALPDFAARQLAGLGMPNTGALQSGQQSRSTETISLNLNIGGSSETGTFPKTDAMKQIVTALQQQKRAAR